jgi:halorhodopsin
MSALLEQFSVLSTHPETQTEIFEYIMEDAALASSFYVNIALAGFTIFAILLLVRNLTDPRTKMIAFVTLMISAVSISSYTGLASGLTVSFLEMPAGHALAGEHVLTMWGRYLTWGLSTPFILIALGLLARSNWTKIAIAVSMTIGMNVTGLAAALTTSSHGLRWFWFAISSAFFIVILYIILAEWAEEAEVAGTGEIFTKLKILTVITWFGYPILWFAGAEGVGLLEVLMTSWGYSVLDIVAKYAVTLLIILYIVEEPDEVCGGEDYGRV